MRVVGPDGVSEHHVVGMGLYVPPRVWIEAGPALVLASEADATVALDALE